MLLRPAAKICVEKALKFLPKLKEIFKEADNFDDLFD